jgi:hypothetical protein
MTDLINKCLNKSDRLKMDPLVKTVATISRRNSKKIIATGIDGILLFRNGPAPLYDKLGIESIVPGMEIKSKKF